MDSVAATISGVLFLLKSMILTWILGGAFLYSAIVVYRNRLKLQDKCEEISNLRETANRKIVELKRMSDLCRKHEEKIAVLQAEIEEYKRVLHSGWRDLRVRHMMLNMDNCPYNQVEVVGMSLHNPEIFCIVKIFEYDKNDPEGYDFAVREAEELIDIIKKA